MLPSIKQSSALLVPFSSRDARLLSTSSHSINSCEKKEPYLESGCGNVNVQRMFLVSRPPSQMRKSLLTSMTKNGLGRGHVFQLTVGA